jgi:hypothetical protein
MTDPVGQLVVLDSAPARVTMSLAVAVPAEAGGCSSRHPHREASVSPSITLHYSLLVLERNLLLVFVARHKEKPEQHHHGSGIARVQG